MSDDTNKKIEAFKTEFIALCKRHGMIPITHKNNLHLYTREEQEAIPGVQSFDKLVESMFVAENKP